MEVKQRREEERKAEREQAERERRHRNAEKAAEKKVIREAREIERRMQKDQVMADQAAEKDRFCFLATWSAIVLVISRACLADCFTYNTFAPVVQETVSGEGAQRSSEGGRTPEESEAKDVSYGRRSTDSNRRVHTSSTIWCAASAWAHT